MSNTIAGLAQELSRELVQERLQRMLAEQRADALRRVGEWLQTTPEEERDRLERVQGAIQQQEP